MSEKIVGNCPYCRKEIEIPAELSEFSCLYCGKRSHIDLLRVQADFKEENLRERASRLPKTLENHAYLCTVINKNAYLPAFSAYESQHGDLLKEIDTMVYASSKTLEENTAFICTVFLDELEKYLNQNPKFQKRQGRAALLFEIKLTMALFLTPLAGKLELHMADSFCTTLHNMWMKRFPKEHWRPGNYANILEGFQRRKLCFITTAVCSHEGKADDCRELTALRSFRDGWLRENGGKDLIARYYDIAPTLVTLMDHCDAPHACYTEIRTRWLEPCLHALERGENEQCRDTYIDMVQTLCNRYLQ